DAHNDGGQSVRLCRRQFDPRGRPGRPVRPCPRPPVRSVLDAPRRPRSGFRPPMARPVPVRQELHPAGALIPQPASAPPDRARWLVVPALLALAAVVRVSAMFYQSISGDDATVALMAKHILSGENWPVFFYRQGFMGSLNGAHMVPALFVFGPSVM